MASKKDVSSPVATLLSKLEKLEKMMSRFGGAELKAGLWQKANHKTGAFRRKFTFFSDSMEQDARTAYANPMGKIPAEFSRQAAGENRRQTAERYAAANLMTPEVPAAAGRKAAEYVQGAAPKTPAGGKSENVSIFRRQLTDYATQETAIAGSRQKITAEEIPFASPKRAKNKSYLSVMQDQTETAENKTTIFSNKTENVQTVHKTAKKLLWEDVQAEHTTTKKRLLEDTPARQSNSRKTQNPLSAQLLSEREPEATEVKSKAKLKYQTFAFFDEEFGVAKRRNPDANTKQNKKTLMQTLTESGNTAEGHTNAAQSSRPLRQTLTEMGNAAESIAAPGNPTINYNITVNDGLIKQVDNHFSSTGESPESATDFMEKFTDALHTVFKKAIK